MKIANVQAVSTDFGGQHSTGGSHPSWTVDVRVRSPVARYPRYAQVRSSWMRGWPGVGGVVSAEDGTQGLGIGALGRPQAALVDDYLDPRIIGEPALATERLYDMMLRLCSPFRATGLASYAVSAIDLADEVTVPGAAYSFNGRLRPSDAPALASSSTSRRCSRTPKEVPNNLGMRPPGRRKGARGCLVDGILGLRRPRAAAHIAGLRRTRTLRQQ